MSKAQEGGEHRRGSFGDFFLNFERLYVRFNWIFMRFGL